MSLSDHWQLSFWLASTKYELSRVKFFVSANVNEYQYAKAWFTVL